MVRNDPSCASAPFAQGPQRVQDVSLFLRHVQCVDAVQARQGIDVLDLVLVVQGIERLRHNRREINVEEGAHSLIDTFPTFITGHHVTLVRAGVDRVLRR